MDDTLKLGDKMVEIPIRNTAAEDFRAITQQQLRMIFRDPGQFSQHATNQIFANALHILLDKSDPR